MTTLLESLRGRRVGVVLSAGYFGFFGHAGFIDGLSTAGVSPAAWAGTSAGGMVAGLAAAGLGPDAIARLLLAQRKQDFWDPDPVGIAVDALRRGPRSSGLLKGARFAALLAGALPVQTFEALPTPLLLVATNLSTHTPQRIAEGALASAIHATCAYPGLFQAVRRDGQLLWDGGIVDKAPVLALHESPVGRTLDALLVHYLPSRDEVREPGGPLAWASGLAGGMAALRREHFRLQLEVLRARGVPVHVVTSELPAVSPNQLQRGAQALAAGRASALAALRQPA